MQNVERPEFLSSYGKIERAATNKDCGSFFFVRRPSETRSHPAFFRSPLTAKLTAKPVDNSGFSWKTLCDFTQFFAASALIKLPQRFSNEHKVGNDKEEILRTLPS